MCEKEKLFLDFIDGFEWRCNYNPNEKYLFGFKNGVCLFEIYSTNGFDKKKFIVRYRLSLEQKQSGLYFLINKEKFWKVFETKFDMNNSETRAFMISMVEKYFKLKLLSVMQTWN